MGDVGADSVADNMPAAVAVEVAAVEMAAVEVAAAVDWGKPVVWEEQLEE